MMRHIKFDTHGLQTLFDELIKADYSIIGPRVKQASFGYDTITTTDDLPKGWITEQNSSTFRLRKTDSAAFFGITHSMNGWNRYLYPTQRTLWKAHRKNNGFEIEHVEEQPNPVALFGVRPCDLEGIKKFDRIFLHAAFPDKTYTIRREHAFIVTVNCTQPSGTCFCVSMDTGPKARTGFDLGLTEIIEDGEHYFIAEVGSSSAQEIIKNIPHTTVQEDELGRIQELMERAEKQMGRELDTDNLKEILYRNYEHPHWDTVAERCFTCGNCTLVCPTCFCTTIEDYTDLTGGTGERIRKWDSCYNNEFSYIHGGSVRTSSYARYRHWLMHKLATYQDQFDTPGCVGCGRCITWCPAGIDITEEATAIRKHGKTS